MKPVGDVTWDGVVAKSPSDASDPNHAGNYELRIENSGRHQVFLWETGDANSTTSTQDAGNAIAEGVCTHIAFSGTAGGGYTFYVNGVATSSGVLPETFGVANANPLYIGNRADSTTTPFDGCLDDVAIFEGAITANQVSAIMNGDFSEFIGPTLGPRILDIVYEPDHPEGPRATITAMLTPGIEHLLEGSTTLTPFNTPGGWAELSDGITATAGQPVVVVDTIGVQGSADILYYRFAVPAEDP